MARDGANRISLILALEAIKSGMMLANNRMKLTGRGQRVV
jgi:hypothetical protein